jgi:kynurenine formamidase
MVANTGTYVDSPFHRYSTDKDLFALPLESLANLSCLVARIEPNDSRTVDALPFKAGLDAVPESGSQFFAVPVKVKGFGTFPVRAFAATNS